MIAIIALTRDATCKAKKLNQLIESDLYVKPFEQSFSDMVKRLFKTYDHLIFIMATGIVVRTIAPLLIHKSLDPGILVMDEKGEHVISLLSGHLGGANALTLHVAKLIGAQAVITTASDVKGLLSVDMFAKKYGLKILNYNEVKEVTAVLVDDEQIKLVSDDCYNELGYSTIGSAVLEITNRRTRFETDLPYAKLVKQNLVLSIGCRKDIPYDTLEKAISKMFVKHDYLIEAISLVTSAWIKSKEGCIIMFCEKNELPFRTCSKEEIQEIQNRFEGSDFVEETIGVRAVSEPCGYIMSNEGEQLVGVIKEEGMTLSLWKMKGSICYTS